MHPTISHYIFRRSAVCAYLIVAAVTASPSSKADANTSFMTGASLLDECSSIVGEADCIGYVSGIADVLGNDSVSGWRACIPADVTRGRRAEITMEFLSGNAAMRQFPGAGLVARAFASAFPCH